MEEKIENNPLLKHCFLTGITPRVTKISIFLQRVIQIKITGTIFHFPTFHDRSFFHITFINKHSVTISI